MAWLRYMLSVVVCFSVWPIQELVTSSCQEGKEEKSSENNKRLLLHSESDIANEMLAMRAELAELRGQVANVTTQNAALKSEVDNLKQNTATVTQASSYVRWGRTVCENNSELVYHGFTAGKHRFTKGGGSDTICLVHDPIWDRFDDSHNGLRATVWGSEIDIEVPSNVYTNNPNQQDMPCALCRSPRPSSVMIPGRKECYPGWTREYWGFLMASWDDVQSEYDHICMDANPEYMQHGGTNDDQHILYLVEARCGSLPCPPYVDGREITCAVCSK